MDQEKQPSEPVRLEVEVLIDAIDAIEENESQPGHNKAPDSSHKPDALPPSNQREVL